MKPSRWMVAVVLLVASALCIAGDRSPLVVRVHLYNADTATDLPDTPVMMQYWSCVLFACKLKPISGAHTDQHGDVVFSVQRRSGLYVRLVECTGDTAHAGYQITALEMRKDTLDLKLGAQVASCEEFVRNLREHSSGHQDADPAH